MLEKTGLWLASLSWWQWLILALLILVGMWFAAHYGLFAWVGPLLSGG